MISIGKLRGLQQCATRHGQFSILALDHRNNLRTALNSAAPEDVSDQQLIKIKRQITAALAREASAVLLDPEFGAAQCIASGAMPGNTGLIVALDATGYSGTPNARHSQVLPDWSVTKARRMGANAVKLLVYYHPDSPQVEEIEKLVKNVATECQEQDIALFLEPLSYSLDPSNKKLKPGDRRRVVVESAKRLTLLGIDVLKAEFPLDISAEPDEKIWGEACAELSAACQVPWVLLSASVSFDTYLRQVTLACQNGASGAAVGRAIWQEAVSLNDAEREQFLNVTACQRMQRTTSLCQALGQPLTNFHSTPEPASNWYASYPEN